MPPRNLISWKPSRTEKPGKAEAPAQQDEAHPFFSWMEPMDRFFKDFFHEFRLERSGGSSGEKSGWTPPKIALTEREKEFRLVVSVPGMNEQDIEVKLSGDLLVLGGSKETEPADAQQGRGARSYSSFYRSLVLPRGIARDDIRAEIKDGTLTLRMPKTEQARKSQRRIEAGQG